MPECAHRTTRPSGVCKQCAVERRFRNAIGHEYNNECDQCGRGTSYADGACHWCRGVDDDDGCERCGSTSAELTRTPVIDIEGAMTLCKGCIGDLDGKGRLPRPVCDGGQDAAGIARMHIAQAITRSGAGEVFATHEHLDAATETLREAGIDKKAAVIEDIAEGDVCSSQVRYDLRQMAQFLDVDMTSEFKTATEVAR